jgi:hypothetical protein
MGDEDDYQIWLDTLGNITIDTSDTNSQQWDDWVEQYTGALSLDLNNINIDYPYNSLGANDIKLNGGGEEMLRVAQDGFYVRGIKVEADAKEAEAVYKAFKQWMTYAILNGEINN